MRKAVSPFIATVILIVITLTVATLLVSWTTSFYKSQTNIVKEREETKIKCSNAGLSIDNVRYNCSSGKVSLDAYNSGYQKLESMKFQIILTNTTQYTLLANNDTLSSGDTYNYYNSTYNLSLSSPTLIDKLIFTSATCPLTAKNTISGSKITGDSC